MRMFDREILLKIVSDFRSVIAPLWTEETAYKIPVVSKYGANIPAGQCAVTCLVLKDVLVVESPNEPTFLVSGELRSTNGDVLIGDHTWLKLGFNDNAVIIDPTADQSPVIADLVIIGTESELAERGLKYVEKEVESSHGEHEHPKRFGRYGVLRCKYEELRWLNRAISILRDGGVDISFVRAGIEKEPVMEPDFIVHCQGQTMGVEVTQAFDQKYDSGRKIVRERFEGEYSSLDLLADIQSRIDAKRTKHHHGKMYTALLIVDRTEGSSMKSAETDFSTLSFADTPYKVIFFLKLWGSYPTFNPELIRLFPR